MHVTGLFEPFRWAGWTERGDTENQASSDNQHQYLPKNYATIYDFIRSTFGIIGYGMHPSNFPDVYNVKAH